MNVRGLFSGSGRQERDEAKRRTVSQYYTGGEVDAMSPEDLDVAVQCISAGTCLCGRSALSVDGAVCPSCSYELSRAIQSGLGLADSSVGARSNIVARRRALPRNARKQLLRRRYENS